MRPKPYFSFGSARIIELYVIPRIGRIPLRHLRPITSIPSTTSIKLGRCNDHWIPSVRRAQLGGGHLPRNGGSASPTANASPRSVPDHQSGRSVKDTRASGNGTVDSVSTHKLEAVSVHPPWGLSALLTAGGAPRSCRHHRITACSICSASSPVATFHEPTRSHPRSR